MKMKQMMKKKKNKYINLNLDNKLYLNDIIFFLKFTNFIKLKLFNSFFILDI